jgi:RNA 3'-terminal phosphate cyclase (ATP)
MVMIEIDGARFSGSGAIVRQAVVLSALTGQSVHILNARQRRTKPGLRPQHVKAVEAVRELVSGTVEGCIEGSMELTFHPGSRVGDGEHHWDIGSAGSTTMLALAALPVMAFASAPKQALAEGGLFQDNAPTYFHLRHVLLPLLHRMGIDASVDMIRPGYVPTGGGLLRLTTRPAVAPLQPLVLEERGPVERIWGVALASRLRERSVSKRMAEAAQKVLLEGGFGADMEILEDDTALQRGAALAAFADLTGGSRLGADRAGAPRRSSEAVGQYVGRQLLQELASGATLDRYAADQVIVYAALADGESRFRIPIVTDHVQAGAWLAREFLGADVDAEEGMLKVRGVGFR